MNLPIPNMKQLISKLLLSAFLLPTFTQSGLPGVVAIAARTASTAQAQTAANTQADTEGRIKRVEQGLLSQVLIKGDPAWSIAERMKFYKVPGLTVAVIKDFKVDWARAYGVKDIETNESVTTETLFQAGSISKSVNAMVAMKKVEQGKISLDEPINNKLVTWKLPENDFTARKKVTLRNLLSHTGGTTVHGFPGYAPNERVPTLSQVLDGAKPANTAAVRVDFEPGSKFRYSGGGTTISQLAIMDIEKQPYPEIAKKTVLEPIGMTNSTYSQPLPDDWRKRAASGHRASGALVEGKIHVYPEMAAAGLWTTPTDLAKFAIEMQLSLAGKSNKVLSKESAQAMTTEIMDRAGLGFFLDKRGNATYFGHGGADEGFRATLTVNRDKGYGAVVMANSDNGQIMEEVIRGIAREYGWDEYLPAPYEVAALDPAKLDNYLGRYRVSPDRVLTLKNESGKLVAYPTGDRQFELVPISETAFVRRDSTVKYNFTREAAANPFGAIELQTGGNTTSAKRVTAETLVPFELLQAGKVDEAIDGYRKIKQANAGSAGSAAITEERLNGLGYGLLQEKKLKEAIAMFKLNVEFYPQASNTYDSLAEAYMTNGDKDLAIANYKKSLELDPQNANAVQMLKKLEGPGQ